jgi:hypothetical protein
MTDPEPREHDHIVEPMFAALREHREQRALERPRRGSAILRIFVWLAIAAAGGATIWILTAR